MQLSNICMSLVLRQTPSQSFRSPWPLVGKRELWRQPFQAHAIDADCALKPDGQYSVISNWLLTELSFSGHWSRGAKTLRTRLGLKVEVEKKGKIRRH